jgi:hypothetical protein
MKPVANQDNSPKDREQKKEIPALNFPPSVLPET